MTHATAEVTAVLAVLGQLAGLLPAVATLLAIVWYLINIWDSRPVRDWFARRRHKQVEVGKEAVTAAIGTAAFKEAVASLPETVSPEAAVVIGSIASAKAVIDSKAQEA